MCEVADYLWNGGKAEGLAEGMAKGQLEALFSLVKDGDLSIEKAAEKLKITVSDFEKKMKEAGYR